MKSNKSKRDIFDPENFHVLGDLAKKASSAYEMASELVAKEVRQFLSGIELDKILKKALAGQEIEINARIRFKADPKPKKTAPKAAKVRAEAKD